MLFAFQDTFCIITSRFYQFLRIEAMPLYSPVNWVIDLVFGHNPEGPFAHGKIGYYILAKIPYACVVTRLWYSIAIRAKQNKIGIAATLKNKIIFKVIQYIPFRDSLCYAILKIYFDRLRQFLNDKFSGYCFIPVFQFLIVRGVYSFKLFCGGKFRDCRRRFFVFQMVVGLTHPNFCFGIKADI